MLYENEKGWVLDQLTKLGLPPEERFERFNQWDETFNKPTHPLNKVRAYLGAHLQSEVLVSEYPDPHLLLLAAMGIHWVRHGKLDTGWGTHFIQPTVDSSAEREMKRLLMDAKLISDALFWLLAQWSEYSPVTFEVNRKGALNLIGKRLTIQTRYRSVSDRHLIPWTRLWTLFESALTGQTGTFRDEAGDDEVLVKASRAYHLAEQRYREMVGTPILTNYPVQLQGDEKSFRMLGRNLARQMPPTMRIM